MNVRHSLFDQIISPDNLLLSWQEFRKGKRSKEDVQMFERYLEDNVLRLHWELRRGCYRHQPYQSFLIFDPKLRHIHKASVKDRVVHHAVFRVLYPIFDPALMYDSYSCRNDKGTHRAVKRLEMFVRNVSQNYKRPCYVLKCDIQKFFASVDRHILHRLLARRVTDGKVLSLLSNIIESFASSVDKNSVGGGSS